LSSPLEQADSAETTEADDAKAKELAIGEQEAKKIVADPDRVKRTVFVGNLPADIKEKVGVHKYLYIPLKTQIAFYLRTEYCLISSLQKLLKMFSKFGEVESSRFRSLVANILCLTPNLTRFRAPQARC
jgi:RNA recognition motif-containing protein